MRSTQEQKEHARFAPLGGASGERSDGLGLGFRADVQNHELAHLHQNVLQLRLLQQLLTRRALLELGQLGLLLFVERILDRRSDAHEQAHSLADGQADGAVGDEHGGLTTQPRRKPERLQDFSRAVSLKISETAPYLQRFWRRRACLQQPSHPRERGERAADRLTRTRHRGHCSDRRRKQSIEMHALRRWLEPRGPKNRRYRERSEKRCQHEPLSYESTRSVSGHS